jgi:hypothetical protein
LKPCAAAIVGLGLAVVAAWAADDETDGPRWPNVPIENAQGGPHLDDGPQWPNIRLEGYDMASVNPRPAFVNPQQVEERIVGHTPNASASNTHSKPLSYPGSAIEDGNADITTGSTARWPSLPAEPQPSPFIFEAGARYWYSSGSMNFGFTNGNPLFGSPTSTLDWNRLTGHSGEAFARLDHIPSGVFAKGVFGLGAVGDGSIVDKDFFTGQFKFSDTTSDVTSGRMSFAMFDVGWAFYPVPDIRVGFFAGYHYWNEKVTANGLLCNQVSIIGCSAPGVMLVGYDTEVFHYEPTWHAARVGFESKIMFADRWSVSGEVAAIPYAALQNKDSHLLRTDLGPSPNVITDSRYAFGVEAELFVNYAVTPNIEISGGVRYWGLTSRSGGVRFGPFFATSNALDNFDHQRYGVLLQVKGKL